MGRHSDPTTHSFPELPPGTTTGSTTRVAWPRPQAFGAAPPARAWWPGCTLAISSCLLPQVDNLKATLAIQEAELKQKNENADKLIHVVGVETEKVSKEKAIADEEEAKVEIINEVGRQARLPSAAAHGSAGPGLPRALSTAPAPRKTCGTLRFHTQGPGSEEGCFREMSVPEPGSSERSAQATVAALPGAGEKCRFSGLHFNKMPMTHKHTKVGEPASDQSSGPQTCCPWSPWGCCHWPPGGRGARQKGFLLTPP